MSTQQILLGEISAGSHLKLPRLAKKNLELENSGVDIQWRSTFDFLFVKPPYAGQLMQYERHSRDISYLFIWQ